MRTSTRHHCPERTASYGRPAGIRVQQRGAITPAAPSCPPPVPVVKPISSPSTQATPIQPVKKSATAVKRAIVGKKEVFTPPLPKQSLKRRVQSDFATNVVRPAPKKQPTATHRVNPVDASRSPQQTRRLARSARLLLAMENKAARPQKAPRLRLKTITKRAMKVRSWRPSLLQAVAIVAVLVSGYASIDAWLVNRRVQQDLRQTVAAAQGGEQQGDTRQAAEGKDETPISQDVISKYTVAADLPRVVTIDKIGARARVLPMGVNSDGSMQAPLNAFDAGWYTGAVKPGQRGASVIIAHEFGPTRGGLFQKLNTIQKGDIVKVERGDGSVLQYQVVATKTASLQDVDMNEFIRPAEGVDEGLNLMSCTGQWVRDAGTRSHRIMVFTKRI